MAKAKEVIPVGNMSYQWIVVLLLWISHVAYYLNFMTIGTLAPFVQSDFGLTLAEIGFLTSALTSGSMIIQIPSGLLADKFGGRIVMSLGLILVGTASFLVFFCRGYSCMFFLLFLVGIGIGANQTPATKTIVSWFPYNRGRATAMGIKQTGVNLAGIVAPFLLPAVAIHFHNWRYSFLLASMVSGVGALLMFCLYRDAPGDVRVSSEWNMRQRSSFRRILTDRDFLLLCGVGILLMMAQFVFSTYFMLYVREFLGFSIRKCGGLLSVAFLSGAAGRIGWSLVSDYVFKGKRDNVLIILSIFGALCSIMLIIVDIMPSFSIYLISVCTGFSVLGWNAIYYTTVGEYPPQNISGTAIGISFVITNIGAILGPPAFGYLKDFTGSYRLGWSLTALCLCGVVLLVKLKKKERMLRE